MKELFAGMALMLLMMMGVSGLVMMADGSADPNVVIAFANGTKVSTSREDGSTQVQESEIAWLPRGFAANTSWTPLGGSQFMQVFWGLTTTLNGANNDILSVDLELPTDFSEKSEEILDKLGPDNAYRFDYWLAAQPQELPSTFFEDTTCGSGANGCDVMAFYNHTFDWYNSALIVHAFRGGSTNQTLHQSFALGSGFSDDLQFVGYSDQSYVCVDGIALLELLFALDSYFLSLMCNQWSSMATSCRDAIPRAAARSAVSV